MGPILPFCTKNPPVPCNSDNVLNQLGARNEPQAAIATDCQRVEACRQVRKNCGGRYASAGCAGYARCCCHQCEELDINGNACGAAQLIPEHAYARGRARFRQLVSDHIAETLLASRVAVAKLPAATGFAASSLTDSATGALVRTAMTVRNGTRVKSPTL